MQGCCKCVGRPVWASAWGHSLLARTLPVLRNRLDEGLHILEGGIILDLHVEHDASAHSPSKIRIAPYLRTDFGRGPKGDEPLAVRMHVEGD